MTYKLLFVCTGNICRSPLAEAVARHYWEQAERHEPSLFIDSAGTHGYHIGDSPDPRTLKVARQNGVRTDGIRARKIALTDFDEFDLILAMDNGHYRHLQAIAAPQFHPKIHLFLDYAGQGAGDVADPYYGDFRDFEEMHRVIDSAIPLILNKISS